MRENEGEEEAAAKQGDKKITRKIIMNENNSTQKEELGKSE